MAREVAGTGAGTGALERVEIVTRGEGRRSYSPEEKAEGRPVRKMSRRTAQRASFVPLLLETASSSRPPATEPAATGAAGPSIEVVLRNGRVLRVGAGTDAAVVARLAAALEA